MLYSKSAWYVPPTLSATNHWFQHFGWNTGINIDQTDDPAKLEIDDLMRYQVLILNSTTNFGQDLSALQKTDLMTWFGQGNGILAIHAAAVHRGAWDWYSRLFGCDFTADSVRTPARLVVDPGAVDHPSVKEFAPEIQITEEWLCFDRPVTGQPGQPGVQVLLRLDESTFEPVHQKFQDMNVKPMGDDHPAAWTRETEGGRFLTQRSGTIVAS